MMGFRIWAPSNHEWMEAQGEAFTVRPVLRLLGFTEKSIKSLFDEQETPAQIGPSTQGFVVVKVRNL